MDSQSQQEADKLPHPAHRLVKWYRQNHRNLPWRETKDPYRILVSETMLQQTRVETVIPYYHAFLAQFPSILSLANAEIDDVLKQWQGLGYYSRARNLKKAAESVVAKYNGVMPDSLEALRSLPGVGPYTAGAVASIAFEKPAPAVDGNVLRVISRFYGLVDPVDTPTARRKITDIVSQWVLEEQPSLFTQSVMELGATVCIPRTPKCLECPLKNDCVAFQTGKTDELPRKTPKKSRKIIHVVAFWLESEQGILLEKRPENGLLAGMWQLPSVEMEDWGSNLNQLVPDKELDMHLASLVSLSHQVVQATDSKIAEEKLHAYVLVGEEKHIFTHIEWRVQVYRPVGIVPGRLAVQGDRKMEYVPRKEVHRYVLPRVYEKIIGSILGERVR